MHADQNQMDSLVDSDCSTMPLPLRDRDCSTVPLIEQSRHLQSRMSKYLEDSGVRSEIVAEKLHLDGCLMLPWQRRLASSRACNVLRQKFERWLCPGMAKMGEMAVLCVFETV
ncbi:hypothetical protein NC651_001510 [Populus alba x Populus x berolinensis]|nr:hypothetical protein NC651_001510 [Populus alba x Populus x berolinensis]